jgi:hypothetical protein
MTAPSFLCVPSQTGGTHLPNVKWGANAISTNVFPDPHRLLRILRTSSLWLANFLAMRHVYTKFTAVKPAPHNRARHSRQVKVVYSLAGRVRVPPSVLSGRRSDALQAASAAQSVRGVESADVTPSGALVIYHDPKAVGAEALLGLLQAHGWVGADSRIASTRRSSRSPAIVSALMRALFAGILRS